MTTRVAVYGPSGSGKSTVAGLLRTIGARAGLTCVVVKLADPLYRLQHQVYTAAGVPIDATAQDQLLLEDLAGHLRRINPHGLADDFVSRLASIDADVVVNDDLRDPHVDARVLRSHGFRLIRLHCAPRLRYQRLAGRGDLSIDRVERSARNLDLIEPYQTITNDGPLDALAAQVEALLRSLR